MHFTLIQAVKNAVEMCEISQNHITTYVSCGVQDLVISTTLMLFGLKYDL
jgi:hypothetical protein